MKVGIPSRALGSMLALALSAVAAGVPGKGFTLPRLRGWAEQVLPAPAAPDWSLAPAAAAAMREYGLDRVARASYRQGERRLTITAYHFSDRDGSYGAFTYWRPDNAGPFEVGVARELGAAAGSEVIFTRGDWLVRAQEGAGGEDGAAVRALAQALGASAGDDPPPGLPFDLPQRGLIANSIRYVEGASAAAQVCDWLPAQKVGFQLGAQMALGQYADGAQVVIVSYPTPQIAHSFETVLESVVGAAAARRSGTYVIAVHGASPQQRAALLQAIHYDASVMQMPAVPPGIANLPALVLGILLLCGVLIGIALVVGLTTGVLQVVLRRRMPERFARAEELTRLDLK